MKIINQRFKADFFGRLLKSSNLGEGCLVKVGNGKELEAVGLQFKPYWWLPCDVTWDLSRTVVVIKLLRTSALRRAQNCL